jgi:hypothetical protein
MLEFKKLDRHFIFYIKDRIEYVNHFSWWCITKDAIDQIVEHVGGTDPDPGGTVL